MQEAAFAQPVIAWVLVKNRRVDRMGEEVFDRAIRETQCISLSVSFRSLTEGRITVAELADTGLQPVPGKRGGVEGVSRGRFELLSRGHTRDVGLVVYGEEVGQYEEQTMLRRRGAGGLHGSAIGARGILRLDAADTAPEEETTPDQRMDGTGFLHQTGEGAPGLPQRTPVQVKRRPMNSRSLSISLRARRRLEQVSSTMIGRADAHF